MKNLKEQIRNCPQSRVESQIYEQFSRKNKFMDKAYIRIIKLHIRQRIHVQVLMHVSSGICG